MPRKKIWSVLLAALLLLLCGCNSNVSPLLDSNDAQFADAYENYLLTHEKLPQSVLDALEFLLDNYISGTSTPDIAVIPQDAVPAGSDEAQQITESSTGPVGSESELASRVLEAVKNIDSELTFEAEGTWCSDEAIYDAVFRQVHDVYMIDAYGLTSYYQTQTQNASGASVYRLQFSYLDDMSREEIQSQRDEINRAANDIVTSLGLSGKSEYERIRAINRYLCDHVVYPAQPYSSSDFTPYGALIEGRAVCDGYARAAKILADLCGLECYYVSGKCSTDSGIVGHAWNLVRVDGQYYQLDVTWNDGGRTNDYFLVTDDFMSLSRTWDTSRYPASSQLPYSA